MSFPSEIVSPPEDKRAFAMRLSVRENEKFLRALLAGRTEKTNEAWLSADKEAVRDAANGEGAFDK